MLGLGVANPLESSSFRERFMSAQAVSTEPTSSSLRVSDDLWISPSVRDRFAIVPSTDGGVEIKPAARLDRRVDLVPSAIWQVPFADAHYLELNLMMGRLHFQPGQPDSKTYRPFSHDPDRLLKGWCLACETIGEGVEEKRDVASMVNRYVSMIADPMLADGGFTDDEIFAAVAPVFERTVGQTDFAELAWLFVLARSRRGRDLSILEIGSFQGRSASVLAKAMRGDSPNAHLISVDPHEDVPQHRDLVRINVAAFGGADRLVQFQSSPEHLTSTLAPDSCSLAFIDGDHSYQAVLRDIACADRCLADEGVIIFHDYWPAEHVDYAVEARLMATVQAIRDSEVLARGYRAIGAVKATIAFQRVAG